MSEADLACRSLGSIRELAPEAWDRLGDGSDPFTAHRFLELLETSGSACERTGWRPAHLLLERAGEPVAAAPLWLKAHSWGEYVFDHAWAEAWARAGGRYYPKLQVAVPFTPVSGPRLFARDAEDRRALVRALVAFARASAVSSLHVTFCREEEARLLAEEGFLSRRGIQFHWFNRGYRDFADFLDALRSDKRKTIRKERARLAAAGLEIELLEGAAAAPVLRAFFPLYRGTVDRRFGNAYLAPAFFSGLAERFVDRVVVVAARAHGRLVAAALHFAAGDALFGRWWGALEEYRFLHFECCYYRAIEFAIARDLARVEAGAQGPHKLLRGYEPVWTRSAHWFRDPALRAAVARFLAAETARLEADRAALRAALPYRERSPD
ncbi:MAG: GNAT family N-acetyltransferase [Geminicoccaceae bacterium]|nr:GNAT family N-acetyltransferase [Geminicoccaceae bacterium]MCS7268234.1 GNAT family N-acetyltransferase [Geminicoccaceae bacterium]MCX7629410.1 GNAT family N-acetyltransferase [Geminicoccaceae bacterium]MDW8124996.1 GNAT family N-acetyltransferase [Geminicoccaceae bacterium]MDW8341207.1 GNAT family N-acetyltransferase [Geminicoccaceae bacterium]